MGLVCDVPTVRVLLLQLRRPGVFDSESSTKRSGRQRSVIELACKFCECIVPIHCIYNFPAQTMIQKLALIALLTAAVGIASCTDTPVNDDPNVYSLKGTLSGWAEIVDYRTTNTYEPVGGLTISVDGTDYKTTSDSTGHWAIRDLPAGT
jgi:hypothetical protein